MLFQNRVNTAFAHMDFPTDAMTLNAAHDLRVCWATGVSQVGDALRKSKHFSHGHRGFPFAMRAQRWSIPVSSTSVAHASSPECPRPPLPHSDRSNSQPAHLHQPVLGPRTTDVRQQIRLVCVFNHHAFIVITTYLRDRSAAFLVFVEGSISSVRARALVYISR